MKKHVFGKKFNRDTNERKALFKGLISSLILKERIQTTEAKAKAIKSAAEKAVTKAKKNGESARSLLGDTLIPAAMEKLVNDIAPRFKNRNGGYTRIIRVGRRFGDNAMEVVMEWTEGKVAMPSSIVSAVNKKGSRISKTTRSLKKEGKSSPTITKKSTGRSSVVSRSGKRLTKKGK